MPHTRKPDPRRRPAALALAIAALAPLAAPLGCDRGRGADVIPAETFVAVMVDLRLGERRLQADTMAGPFEELREEVLARHGVTEAQLRRFVLVHGSDLPRMERVWGEIEQGLREVRPDTAGPSGVKPRAVDGPAVVPTETGDTGVPRPRPIRPY